MTSFLQMKSAEGAPYTAAKQRQIVAPGASPGFVASKTSAPKGRQIKILRPSGAIFSFTLFTPGWRPGLQSVAASQLFADALRATLGARPV